MLYFKAGSAIAGHSDIKTTQQFYLSVRDEDVTKAQEIQAKLLGKILTNDPTDQILTNSGKKRVFPGIRGFSDRKQVLG